MESLLYAELNIFCILIVLVILYRIVKGIDMSQRQKLFIYMLIASICLFTTDLLWVFADMGILHVSIRVNYLINACYFMSTGFMGFFWFLYSEYSLGVPILQNKTLQFFGMCPVFFLFILIACSYKTGWLFYFDANGDYQRGNLFLLQPAVFYGYVLYTTIRALFMASKKENWVHREKYLSLISFTFFPFLCCTIQIFIPGLPLICIGITLSILIVYLQLQSQQISLDPLTGLNNRSQLTIYLNNKLRHRDDNYKQIFLLMMDADYFKKINDKYGHIEGDQALKYIATALRKAGSIFDCFICRFGGDEFIVVYETDSNEDVTILINYINQALATIVEEKNLPYRLTLSIGYAQYLPEMSTLQDLISAADAQLYKVKLARH